MPNPGESAFIHASGLHRAGLSEPWFRPALEVQSGRRDALPGLAPALRAERRDAEALTLIRQVRALAPGTVELHVREEALLQDLDPMDKAVHGFEEALPRDPGNPRSWRGWMESRPGTSQGGGPRVRASLREQRP